MSMFSSLFCILVSTVAISSSGVCWRWLFFFVLLPSRREFVLFLTAAQLLSTLLPLRSQFSSLVLVSFVLATVQVFNCFSQDVKVMISDLIWGVLLSVGHFCVDVIQFSFINTVEIDVMMLEAQE